MIDYIFQFPNIGTAQAAAIMQQFMSPGPIWSPWNTSRVIPVNKANKQPIDANYYVLVSDTTFRADLWSSPSCIAIFDRDAALSGNPWLYKSGWTNAQLNGMLFEGAFAGSGYDKATPSSISVSIQPGTPIPVPPPASAAGKTTLVLNENFTKWQTLWDGVSYQGDSGIIWYNGIQTQGTGGAFDPRITWGGPGLLTLKNGGLINTHARTYQSGFGSAKSTVFLQGYFEARMRLIGPYDAVNQNWASFWLFSALHQEVFADPAEWSEIDIFESGFYPKFSAVVHDWHFKSGVNSESPPQSPDYSQWADLTKVDLTQWHTYGALWTTGRVNYYLDNVLQQSAVSNPINDTDPCSLLLSTHASATSMAQFQWVHVFQ